MIIFLIETPYSIKTVQLTFPDVSAPVEKKFSGFDFAEVEDPIDTEVDGSTIVEFIGYKQFKDCIVKLKKSYDVCRTYFVDVKKVAKITAETFDKFGNVLFAVKFQTYQLLVYGDYLLKLVFK